MNRHAPGAVARPLRPAGAPTAGADEPALLREMIDGMDQGMILFTNGADGGDIVRVFNAQASRILDLPDGFLREGLSRGEIAAFTARRGDAAPGDRVTPALGAREAGREARTIARHPGGRHVLTIARPRAADSGVLELYVDVTHHMQQLDSLRESEERHRVLAEVAPTGIVKLDAAGRVVFANEAAATLLDRTIEEIDLTRQLVASDGRPVADHLGASARFEAEIRAPYHTHHVLVSLAHSRASPGIRIVTIADFTPLREARLQIEHLARHDSLTRLGNRHRFNERWGAMVRAPGGEAGAVHIVALDLDHFKAVNDDHGHQVGDHLLRAVAKRLQSVCDGKAELFRLGGDEFAAILSGAPRARAIALAERVVVALAEPFDLDEVRVTIGCSAGVATLGLDGDDADAVQKAADLALYQVKRNGRSGVATFDLQREAERCERRRLEADLARAIAEDEFFLVFQRQIDLPSGRTSGMEALLRWRNPRLDRLVPPSDFIPVAEALGLITLIDAWVIRAATAQFRAFAEAGVDCPTLSINLSPTTLAGVEVVDTLKAALARHDIPPDRIEIEVTEGVAITQMERVGATLRAIREAGMKVAIDDFGAGHTSLTYIRSLPIDRVKIDRSIIEGLGRDQSTGAIIMAVHALCDQLGLRLTAEGIETAAQADVLRAMGGIDGQGFHLARPEKPARIVEHLLREGAAWHLSPDRMSGLS